MGRYNGLTLNLILRCKKQLSYIPNFKFLGNKTDTTVK